MSKKRYVYYLGLLESLYSVCVAEHTKKDFEVTSLSLVTKLVPFLALTPPEYYALCKRRAELLIKYGKEAV